eukprot:CAMPEP_0174733988 /NCGR_PEP_ID=MMETSP1094-20130205/62388_1 /TAXON_ID=156173 /ORGANISM="Chrysochromulina brevifilum, Strain UTEX LB 985" /LENGTH=44 /DNA_ID= /DNA_START= /DNA_END= /DNA_ORIENTATION=
MPRRSTEIVHDDGVVPPVAHESLAVCLDAAKPHLITTEAVEAHG